MTARPISSPQNVPVRIAAIEAVARKRSPRKVNAMNAYATRYSRTFLRNVMLNATISNAMPTAIAIRRRTSVTCIVIGISDCAGSMSVRCCQSWAAASRQCAIKLRISAGALVPRIGGKLPCADSVTANMRSRICRTSGESEAANLVAAARSSSLGLTRR